MGPMHRSHVIRHPADRLGGERLLRPLAMILAVSITVGWIGAAAPTSASAAPAMMHRGTMYVIGDSWSAGLFADPQHTLVQDAADELGLTATVDAESGTGYVAAPPGSRTYIHRARHIPTGTEPGLVLIQGGSNDDGTDPSVLLAAADRTIAEVRASFPTTLIVLLGPGPDPWPVTPKQTAVDDVLREAAAANDAGYISPIADGWFTSTTVRALIDPLTAHPTVSGDELLGQDLADALIRLHKQSISNGSAP